MDDIQSWWEIPCIAHFCSLFRLYFDLIDFDIEELEEALLTDSVEEVGSSLLQDLIVRLLKGCFNSQKDEITTCNYQMYLRRLFRKKCEEGSTKNNPFDKDAAFHSLPLRIKVEILYDLCDFRLDNDDVPESLKSLEADSLRVEPLGQDSGGSTYWYFYGTRLYREDYTTLPSVTTGKKRGKKAKEDQVLRSWQVVCYTEEDWQLLTRKFKNCKSLQEKKLHRTLRDDFLPELPRLFAEKERLQRKRMMEQQLRRSGRTVQTPESGKDEMPTPGEKKPSSTVDKDECRVKDHEADENEASDEYEIRRRREEQEKADRLLAEEMEREERMTRLHLRERRGGDRGGFSGSESFSSLDRTSNQNKSSSQRKVANNSKNKTTKSPSKALVKGSTKNGKQKHSTGRKSNNSMAASLPSSSNSDEDETEEPENCDSDESDRVVKSKKKSNRDEENKSRSVKSTKKPKEDDDDNDYTVKSKKKHKDEIDDDDRPVKPKKKTKEEPNDSARFVKSKKKVNEDESYSIGKSKKTLTEEEDDDDNDGDSATKASNKKKYKGKEENESRSRSSSPNPRSTSSPSKKLKKEDSVKSKKKKSGGHEESNSKKLKSKDKKRLKMRHRDKSREKDKLKSRNSPDKSNSVKKKEKGPSAIKPASAMVTVHSTGGMSKAKMKSSVLFSQSEEDVQIGMHKVIESIKNHGDAWPFLNPVDEDYAPNYYRVISSPMDLQTIEDKLDNQEYSSLDEFIADFQRIVDNCTKYNGPANEYTEMAETLQEAFNKAIQRYIIPDESDEEISIEYNNVEVERKRPRLQNHSKKEETPPEHKKENEPTINKTTVPKKKVQKTDKKKLKQKLMGHHSRNSEAIENLTSATAETLKDINKWLGDTPKPPDFQSSPGSLRMESVKNRIPDEDDDKDVFHKKSGSIAGQKRKNPISLNNRSVSGKRDERKKDDDDDDEDFTPPKKMLKKSDKHGKNDNKSKTKKETKQKSSESSSKKSADTEVKEKEKHHHKHHKHHHSSSENRKRESSTKVHSKVNGSNSKMTSSGSNREKDSHNPHGNPPKENSFDKIALKHSKSVEEKKPPKPPIKRGNSLLNSLKNSGAMKRMQQINKTPKFNSFQSDSKFKSGSGEFKGGPGDHVSGANVQGTGRENGLLADKPEKKKCLLLNDNPFDRDGGPRLSLGSVLSTDAIKLGAFKKEEVFSDDDYESTVSVSTQKAKQKSDVLEPSEENTARLNEEKDANGKASLSKEAKEIENDAENEEDHETDRKLEPSKGFNREKCMPNLSAWIKAFGCPAKAASGPGTGNPQIKKPDPESKTKFKVMGRGVGESNPQPTTESVQKGSSRNSPGATNSGKPMTENQSTVVHSPLVSPNKSNEQTRLGNASEDVASVNEQNHTNKKRRHRKMSTSSLSSQSESGSPHCFNTQDGSSGGVANVVNPPRWVDEHWTQSHSQSQSPSASSHVSSQSPANSPFSPAINSPPQTPQTPPRPVGPVHVGFYQDITSQHSGPKNLNEAHSNSNSNVASPSTPPTPTSANTSRRGESCSNTGNEKAGYGSYPAPVYTPRYAASTPSPNVGPGSNIQSPSPGGMGSVESPGDPNSPHSPNVSNPSGGSTSLPSLPDYRNLPSYGQSSQQQNSSAPHQNPQQLPAHQQQPTAHRVPSSIMNAHGGHAPPPSIAPYPPPVSHYGHPGSMSQPHPESAHSGQMPVQAHQPAIAHMNQVQAHSQISHQQHYERYPPHNLAHHQMNPQSGMLQSSVPSSTAATSYSQNMTAAHSQRPSTAQPSPYPSNPYTSNPRSINIPPNVYNNPISSDPAMNRFYKPSVSGGELSLTANISASSSGIGDSTSTATSSGSHSRGRSSRANAAAALEAELPRNAPAGLEGKLSHGELNGFQWPHNLASLSQIVNSIPNPMGAVGMANAYRQYDQAMAESMSKYQRADPSGYTSLSASAGANASSASARSGTPVHHPPAAHSQSEKSLGDASSESSGSSSRSRSTKSAESKASRSQATVSKVTAQSMVPGSAFNFSSLSPADLALYPKEMTDPGSIYSASQSGLGHRPDLYPTSTSNFHPSFSSASRTTAGGVQTSSLTPYQIPPFIGSHPSPYQPQSVSSQPFAHSQHPRSLAVDPYQQFLQSSPHVMGLLPPAGYPYPHGLGFNRPGWI